MAQALAMRVLSVPASLANLEASLDDRHRPLAVRQDGEHLRLVHQLRPRHADVHIDDHGIARLAERRSDGQRIVPQRVAQRPAGALVGSEPRMSVPMPISSTMRFFAIVSLA